MQGDTLRPWLTLAQFMGALQLRDRRAAGALAADLGGVKVGGRWRIPPDALDRLLVDPDPVTGRDKADPRLLAGSTVTARHVPDPVEASVPSSIGADWWRQETAG